ncbi:MAG: hypothetical protein JXA24_01115 [Proteobacteria bacterium]|nr:hypothetical protein [Pseudomonadota bacterium]
MRRIVIALVFIAVVVPSAALARGIEESEVGAYESKKTEVAVAPKKRAEPVAEEYGPPVPETSQRGKQVMIDGRKGSFRLGIVGPGFAVANRGIGPMMNMGVEGEYFFFERLSVGMQIDVATEFDDYAILSFLPYARYVFDLNSHPRWSLYVQAGVGPALINGDSFAADIAIPGGGFWWQWTERLSVGADAWFHVFVRDRTAVGFSISPAVRYQF